VLAHASGRRRRRAGTLRSKRGAGPGCGTPSMVDEGAAGLRMAVLRRLVERQHGREAGVAAFEQGAPLVARAAA
jgi:hypothetical protein